MAQRGHGMSYRNVNLENDKQRVGGIKYPEKQFQAIKQKVNNRELRAKEREYLDSSKKKQNYSFYTEVWTSPRCKNWYCKLSVAWTGKSSAVIFSARTRYVFAKHKLDISSICLAILKFVQSFVFPLAVNTSPFVSNPQTPLSPLRWGIIQHFLECQKSSSFLLSLLFSTPYPSEHLCMKPRSPPLTLIFIFTPKVTNSFRSFRCLQLNYYNS